MLFFSSLPPSGSEFLLSELQTERISHQQPQNQSKAVIWYLFQVYIFMDIGSVCIPVC